MVRRAYGRGAKISRFQQLLKQGLVHDGGAGLVPPLFRPRTPVEHAAKLRLELRKQRRRRARGRQAQHEVLARFKHEPAHLRQPRGQASHDMLAVLGRHVPKSCRKLLHLGRKIIAAPVQQLL
eukprot:scaffold1426_cov263-Pinguiococcus_pyrenoidosus.AAC.3